MKVSLLIWALIVFIVGFILSINTGWAIIGILLITISIIILLIGLFMSDRKRNARHIREIKGRRINPVRKVEIDEKAMKEEKETPRKQIGVVRKRTRRKRR